MIDGHGDDLFRYRNKIKINFSTNIPQNVDHSGLIAHLAEFSDIISSYPEPEPRSVEEKLAGTLGLAADNIMVTNGATEAIYLIAQTYSGCRSSIIIPTFREYQDACRIFNHSVCFASSLEEIKGYEDVVWLCNPNNPDGRVSNRKELLEVIDRCPDILFIVDQAYEPYSIKEVLSAEDVIFRQNIGMLQSLTKQFVVPGLRIGYVIANAGIINRVRSLRMPWSVNAMAIEAAHYLLENANDYVIDAASLHSEAMRLTKAFRKLDISVAETDCNFILAKLPSHSASELKEWLIENHGLLIRDASNFQGLSNRHFRVAAQTQEENNLLIKAIEEWTSLS